jgi:hypothetical protein
MKSVPSLPSLCLTTLFALPALASGAVTQTNFGTGDGTLPGVSPIVRANNLLFTRLASASRTGAGVPNPGNLYFYRENDGYDGYDADLARLYDGQFGAAGGVSSASVLPNQVSLTFDFNLMASPAGYNLSTIQTYAGWDSGRDGQQYTVEYSTAAAPGVFLSLKTISRFDNTDFPLLIEEEIYDDEGETTGRFQMVPDKARSATLVQLQADTGFLAENVAALRFNFTGFGNAGNAFENGGTGYREFVVQGSQVSAVPEPATMMGTLGLLASGLLLRRRTVRPR